MCVCVCVIYPFNSYVCIAPKSGGDDLFSSSIEMKLHFYHHCFKLK